MSLKALHVVLLCLSILLMLGTGGWLVVTRDEPLALAFAAACFAFALGLLAYGRWFLIRHREISYL
ncbi:MAG: hypothetical protein AAF604_20065 [Acidobacteriota bacterium]